MTFLRDREPDSDEWNEAQRLRNDEKRIRDDERAEEYPDSPLVRYVKANPYDAAAQIEALQEAVKMMVDAWHDTADEKVHGGWFEVCNECRKLRNRLRPVTETTYVP